MAGDSCQWCPQLRPSGRILLLSVAFTVVLGLFLGGLLAVTVGGTAIESADTTTSNAAQAGANFTVRITSTNSPVVENETLHVFATVHNSGNDSGTQTVTLVTDGVVREREDVTLQPGESQTVKLDWQTSKGDAGKYVAVVETANDSDSTPVTVRPPGGIPIESCTKIDEPGLYVLNETIRTFDTPQCIRITVSDVALHGQGFTVNGVDEDPKSVGINVSAAGSIENVTVRNLTVTGWNYGIKFGAGKGISQSTLEDVNSSKNDVGVHVSNGRNNVFRNNTFRNNTDAIILEGSSENSFRNTTVRDNTGLVVSASPSGNVGSSARNTFSSVNLGFANASVSFTLRDAAVERVRESAAPSPPSGKVDIGIFLSASTTDTDGYLDLTVNYRETKVAGIDESTLSLWRRDGNWTDVGGTLDVTANTLTKNVTEFSIFAPLASEPSPNFAVNIEGTTSPVIAGEMLEIIATIRNTGERTGTQTVVLETNGTVRDNATVTLEPGEPETITFVWPTGSGDVGTYAATVRSANDSASTNVTVEAPNEPPNAAIRYSPQSPSPGETVLVAATGSKDPDGTIVSYEWQIDGQVVSTSESFEHTFESAGTFEVELKVTDNDGGTATTTITIDVSAPTPTPTSSPTRTETTGRTVPGFGAVVALVALLCVGLLLGTRRKSLP